MDQPRDDVPPLPLTTRLRSGLWRLFPGLAVAVLIAAVAELVARQYGGPVMLLALLIGIALNGFGRASRTAPGISVAGSTFLRLGVVCLGARIGAQDVASLGAGPLLAVGGAVAATIVFGVLLARRLGLGTERGFLTGGATAICGASAALAISAALPKRPGLERDTGFAIIAVTAASTLAMILYPLYTALLGLDDATAGFLIGATIHDVAQVVGAGFTISDTAGETATLTKLFRVALLVPVVFVASVAFGQAQGKRGWRAYMPAPMLLGFIAMAGANSLGLLPDRAIAAFTVISRELLVIAVAAIGLKTNLADLRAMGWRPVALVLAETLVLLALISAVVWLIL